jgi:glyoxylase-like metal-dependent hydrolase (beta-lactamase superfamily II)
VLNRVADRVLVHESECIQSNAVIVEGDVGVLLVDPGITEGEMAQIARDLDGMGLPVVAGFSTHPDWDHALWHPDLGDVPRYGTASCAGFLADLLADPGWRQAFVDGLPPEFADEIPPDLFGLVAPLPEGARVVLWDGPPARILEHRGHSVGHAALLFTDLGVLVAGDMVSDVLPPMPDPGASSPLDDYLAALDLFEQIAGTVEVFVPGHGSVGDGDAFRRRIEMDRAYVHALREGSEVDDPRIDAPGPGWEWVSEFYPWQAESFGPR